MEGSACEATELLYHYFPREECGVGSGGIENSDKLAITSVRVTSVLAEIRIGQLS